MTITIDLTGIGLLLITGLLIATLLIGIRFVFDETPVDKLSKSDHAVYGGVLIVIVVTFIVALIFCLITTFKYFANGQFPN